MNKRTSDNFDIHSDNYEEVLNRTMAFTGGNLDYFCAYKVRTIKQIFPLDDGLKILDFGCGIGEFYKHFRGTFLYCHYRGIDISKKCIDIAKAMNEPADFSIYDGERLPTDTKYDLVFASNVFHHIAHSLHANLFEQIRELIKPGGLFIIVEHNPLNPVTRRIVRDCPFDEDAHLIHHKVMRTRLIDAGFSSSRSYFISFIPPRLRPLGALERFLRRIPLGAQYIQASTV